MDKIKNKKLMLGVIADDFTGASDIASFLAAAGHKTILYNSLPNYDNQNGDCIVIALKCRNIPSNEAVSQVRKAYHFLQQKNCKQYYFKYCSTFDSTPKGNIGPVMDSLLEESNQKYSILCPSLPVNGRTVKNGILYVNGEKLADSPMRNHPLNPMLDSSIPNLMEAQSNYHSWVIRRDQFTHEKLNELIRSHETEKHFYLVPDYESDDDGKKIANLFKNVSILSGGSGLAQHLLPAANDFSEFSFQSTDLRTIILCGSCSQATQQQILNYQKQGLESYPTDPADLENGKFNEYQKIIVNNKNVILFYSCSGKLTGRHKEDAKAIETLNALLAKSAINNGYTRIIVAGGETSGAVALQLGFNSFYIGKSIDPGVPELHPCQKPEITLVFKSGNFGSSEFFLKAIPQNLWQSL